MVRQERDERMNQRTDTNQTADQKFNYGMSRTHSLTPLLVGCFFGGLLFTILFLILFFLTKRHKHLGFIPQRRRDLGALKSKQNQSRGHTSEYDLNKSKMMLHVSTRMALPVMQSTQQSANSNRSSAFDYSPWDHTTSLPFHQVYASNRSSTITNNTSVPRPYSYQSLPVQQNIHHQQSRHLSLPPISIHNSSAYAYLNNLDEDLFQKEFFVPSRSQAMIKTNSAPSQEIQQKMPLEPFSWPISDFGGYSSPNSAITSENIHRTNTMSESSLRHENVGMTDLIIKNDVEENLKKPRPVSCGPYFANSSTLQSSSSFHSRQNASVGHGLPTSPFKDELEEIKSDFSKTNLSWANEIGTESKRSSTKVRMRTLSLKKIRRSTFKSMESIENLPKLIRDKSAGSMSNSSIKRSAKFSDPSQSHLPRQEFQSVSLSSTFRSINVTPQSLESQSSINQEGNFAKQVVRFSSHTSLLEALPPPTQSFHWIQDPNQQIGRRPSNFTINSLTGELRNPLRTRISHEVSSDSSISSPMEAQRESSSCDSDKVIIGHTL